MADELAEAGVDVQLLSINKISAETGVSSFTDSMDLPMVQDTTTLGVWTDWGAAWRDVHLVDRDNVHVGTYNLSTYNLGDPENYAELKGMFEDLAAE
jgi:hypothetical protein